MSRSCFKLTRRLRRILFIGSILVALIVFLPGTLIGSNEIAPMDATSNMQKSREMDLPLLRRKPTRIAIMIQVPATSLVPWAKVFGAMETRHDIDAFLLAFQRQPTAEEIATAFNASNEVLVEAWYEPSTTWTTGRNFLARAAYAREVARGAKYRYWVFMDEELLQCEGCRHHIPPGGWKLPEGDFEYGKINGTGMTACCMDFIVRAGLLAPYKFVALSRPYSHVHEDEGAVFDPSKNRIFRGVGCADGKFAGLHRDAVPVLLPYIAHFGECLFWGVYSLSHSILVTHTPAPPTLCLSDHGRFIFVDGEPASAVVRTRHGAIRCYHFSSCAPSFHPHVGLLLGNAFLAHPSITVA